MKLPATGHDPVMLDEVLKHLRPTTGTVVVDCTLGRGGHSRALASKLAPDGLLIGLDADPRNLEFAQRVLSDAPCRVRLFHANFAELDEVLDAADVAPPDAILADLGLSTNQLFDPQYGLSFDSAVALDMRIDPRSSQNAADLVNRLPERDLADLLFTLADERWSRRIARKIAEARTVSPILTTDRLADVVRSAVPVRGGAPHRIDPATRTFLALRMAVNNEVDNLRRLLETAIERLAPQGRLAVISFQSTEDRLVKQAFRSAEQTGLLHVATPKPLQPTDGELARNPRSRSAKLRVAGRTDLPWPRV